MEELRVYAACLQSYNEGRLVGDWITLESGMEPSDLLAKIDEVIKGEEWAFHDNEVPFNCPEFADIEGLLERSQAYHDLASHGYDESAVYALFKAEPCFGAEEITRAFEDNFHGVHESAEDFGYSFLEEQGADFGQFPYNYFDMESFVRDLGFEGWLFLPVPEGVAVFGGY